MPTSDRQLSSTRSRQQGSPPPVDNVVTQELLAEYVDLQRQVAVIQRRREKLRTRLFALHDRHAHIERGMLQLNITAQEYRRFSLANVALVVGTAEANRIRAAMPRSVVRRLCIEDLSRTW